MKLRCVSVGIHLYDIDESFQFKAGFARGFRAPQAFNEDLHVSSVGGEQQFILIGNDLDTEYSNARPEWLRLFEHKLESIKNQVN